MDDTPRVDARTLTLRGVEALLEDSDTLRAALIEAGLDLDEIDVVDVAVVRRVQVAANVRSIRRAVDVVAGAVPVPITFDSGVDVIGHRVGPGAVRILIDVLLDRRDTVDAEQRTSREGQAGEENDGHREGESKLRIRSPTRVGQPAGGRLSLSPARPFGQQQAPAPRGRCRAHSPHASTLLSMLS